MSKYLITGVSSGIGRALAKRLIYEGNMVWGIARRQSLLEDLKKELKSANFFYSDMDISKRKSWENLAGQMKKADFVPDKTIFNAAINKNDFVNNLETDLTREMFDINLFGALEGIKVLLKFVNPKAEFMAISSSSALKGSGVEGIGYPASKAALSIAFESLYQKYKGKYTFKTIYFGPINTGMVPFREKTLFMLSEKRAVSKIIQAAEEKKVVYYYPGVLFFILKTIKLFPPKIYFNLLSQIEEFHKRRC